MNKDDTECGAYALGDAEYDSWYTKYPRSVANTPGVSKAVEYEGCINGVCNLKRLSFRFLTERQTDRHTHKLQGYDITITVPNKSTSQLYMEWLSSFGFTDTGSSDSKSLSFLRVRSGQYLSRALQPTKSSQDRFGRMYSYTKRGTKGCVGSTYDIKARTVGEEKILELVPNTSIGLISEYCHRRGLFQMGVCRYKRATSDHESHIYEQSCKGG